MTIYLVVQTTWCSDVLFPWVTTIIGAFANVDGARATACASEPAYPETRWQEVPADDLNRKLGEVAEWRAVVEKAGTVTPSPKSDSILVRALELNATATL